MEQGKVAIQLLEDRIKFYTQLKNLLFEQQRALVASDSEQVTHFSEMQLDCLSKLQSLENRWKIFITEIKEQNNLETESTDQFVSLVFGEEGSTKIFAYLDKIQKLIREIDMVKRNNTMLIQNSLTLVRSTLKMLQGDKANDAVYNPYRKPGNQYLVVNKKF